ncbi:hypothetical protein [Xylella fastidiosa]|uniref:hypothetical protein n=1 Tax=Xylella fastidiosa TaxID=2371 RepID=UPI0012BCD0F1|nr:hypothetical protein [Xylella fastidiosa]MDC7971105.1 hypothetical protein [Xylella fastidiosa subsp. multiplex]WDF06373.1 hypothetical protein PT012_07805 [Xylella fastidiosa subsp. multiplex]
MPHTADDTDARAAESRIKPAIFYYLPTYLPAWMDGWIQFQTRAMTPSVALAAPRITLTDQSSVAILSIGALRCCLSPVTPNANRPPSPVMIRCRFLPSVPQSLSFSPVY